MNKDIQAYHEKQTVGDKHICDKLHEIISDNLPGSESKVWHAHPVWFLDGNPIVGYSKLRDGVRLMFWSGQSFDEPGLAATGTFKAAEVRYVQADEIDEADLKRYIHKSIDTQWDYKNIIKNRGLGRLK